MRTSSVEIIDKQIARLKALLRRLRAERKVAFLTEQHRAMKEEKNQKLAADRRRGK